MKISFFRSKKTSGSPNNKSETYIPGMYDDDKLLGLPKTFSDADEAFKSRSRDSFLRFCETFAWIIYDALLIFDSEIILF